MKKLNIAKGKVEFKFRITPRKVGKSKVFKDLNEAIKDFSEEEIRNSDISVLMNALIVGYLDADKVANELYY